MIAASRPARATPTSTSSSSSTPTALARSQLTHGDTLGVGLCCAAWSPDGQSLVFQGGPADNASQLYTIAVDGTTARQLTTDAGSYGNYSWSSYPSTGLLRPLRHAVPKEHHP